MNHLQQATLLRYAHAHGYTDRSPSYTACSVRIDLTQALGGTDPVHLDALLQSALVRDALQGETLEPSTARYEIPVPLEVLWRSDDGGPLYHCSDLLPEGKVQPAHFTWTKKNDPSVSFFSTRRKDGNQWQPDDGAGPNKAYCRSMPLRQVSCLLGYAVGDPDEIQRLLSLLTGIGKKHAWGLGTFAQIRVDPCDLPHRYCFVRGGQLLRPLPLAACQALGLTASGEEGDAQLIGWTPPYWLPLNQAPCFVEHQPVTDSDAPQPPVTVEHLSVAEFLWRAWVADSLRYPRVGGTTFLHAKYQPGAGVGEPCALTGLPITEGAVPAKVAFSSNMGNVADFCHAPRSPWVSNAAAIILGMPKQMHRNLVALLHPTTGEAHLLWPTIAVNPSEEQQPRPLWREVILALDERYRGYRCLLIFKDEPKSRTWPRGRIGVIGEQTPIYLSESVFGMESLLHISLSETVRQLQWIEQLLDAGHGKTEIRQGLKSLSIDTLITTLVDERQLAAIRETPEFLLAWHSARFQNDRLTRKDIPLELT